MQVPADVLNATVTLSERYITDRYLPDKMCIRDSTGVFPEQAVNWAWYARKIRAAGRPVKVLNLFGYTECF